MHVLRAHPHFSGKSSWRHMFFLGIFNCTDTCVYGIYSCVTFLLIFLHIFRLLTEPFDQDFFNLGRLIVIDVWCPQHPSFTLHAGPARAVCTTGVTRTGLEWMWFSTFVTKEFQLEVRSVDAAMMCETCDVGKRVAPWHVEFVFAFDATETILLRYFCRCCWVRRDSCSKAKAHVNRR